jgi:hypothetical protein
MRQNARLNWATMNNPPLIMVGMCAGIVLVGLFSLFMRLGIEKRSSWPTWLYVPVAIWIALPLGDFCDPPDVLYPLFLAVQVLVLVRWAVAVAYCEQGFGWVFYICILVAVPFGVGPALRGYGLK